MATKDHVFVHRDEASGWLVVTIARPGKELSENALRHAFSPEMALRLRDEIGRMFQHPCPCHQGQAYDSRAGRWRVVAEDQRANG